MTLSFRKQHILQNVKISEVLTLCGFDTHKRTGTFQILCPFHEDSSPSARVYGDTQKLYCYTCGKIWDSIGVVIDLQKIPYHEALTWLEDHFGIKPLESDLVTSVSSILKNPVSATRTLTELHELAEVSAFRVRHSLGVLGYSNLLMALDRLSYEYTNHIRTYEDVKSYYKLILAACDKTRST